MNDSTLPPLAPRLTTSRRQRSTPYTARIEALGVSDYAIVNHMILPKGFGRSVEEDYWHLRQHVQLWDVSCQRQVELTGPDAARMAQLMTPRDLSRATTGQCLYAPLVDSHGGMINDPIILKLADDHFWFSIADSDVLWWSRGLAVGLGLNVVVSEPDVSPLAVQGPKSGALMARVFGSEVNSIGYFRFEKLEFEGLPLVIARSGYSKQGGFEIYLHEPSRALALWDALWQAGADLDVAPGSPNLIERIEGGLLSYGNEMTSKNNPLECGLARFCQLDGTIDYIGCDALMRINETGPDRQIRGLLFDGDRCPPCATPWPVLHDNKPVGIVTSAIWSPRFNTNIALAMLNRDYWHPQTGIEVASPDGEIRSGKVMALPFTGSN